jgi:hypothetical protein
MQSSGKDEERLSQRIHEMLFSEKVEEVVDG